MDMQHCKFCDMSDIEDRLIQRDDILEKSEIVISELLFNVIVLSYTERNFISLLQISHLIIAHLESRP